MKCARCHGTGEEPTASLLPDLPAALTQTKRLREVPRLHAPEFWEAAKAANPGIDLDREILAAEAWIWANTTRAPRKDLARFMLNWLKRADRGPKELPPEMPRSAPRQWRPPASEYAPPEHVKASLAKVMGMLAR